MGRPLDGNTLLSDISNVHEGRNGLERAEVTDKRIATGALLCTISPLVSFRLLNGKTPRRENPTGGASYK